MKNNKYIKLIPLLLGVIILSLIIGIVVWAWTEPTVTLPGANVAAPINVGTTTQHKAGEIGATIFRDRDNTIWFVDPSGNAVIAGNVGIGTTAPTRILGLGGAAARNVGMERGTVADTAGFALTVNAGGATSGGTNRAGGNLLLTSGVSTGNAVSDVIVQTSGGGASGTADRAVAEVMRITGAGNVGIGTVSPTRRLDVAGEVIANAYFHHSDRVLKTGIEPIRNGLQRILGLEPVAFNWKNDGEISLGFIAQDVEQKFPELVTTDVYGSKAVNYSGLIAPLIQAIQEQQKQIQEQQVEINELRTEIEKLK